MEAISKAIPGDDALTLRRPMRAILQSGYGTADVFRVGIAERPTAGVGEVVVRVHAAGLDRGTWHLMTGRPYLMRLMGFGFSAPKNPVPGLDVAGTVVEVGPSVTRFKVGDEVFGIGTGSFAEYARAREEKLASKPSSLSFEQAAVLGVSGGTALQALQHGQLKAGERILIVGASGGVGTFAVQLAKALGAAVTAVCSTSKVETVRSLGADEVIDYRQRDFTVSDAKYDLILDIGGHTPVSRLRRVMTPTGRLVFVGDELGGDWTAGFERQLLAFAIAPFVKQRFMGLMAREHFEELEQLAKLADAGKLAPVIDRECSLAQMVEAMRDLEAGRVCGKVALKLG